MKVSKKLAASVVSALVMAELAGCGAPASGSASSASPSASPTKVVIDQAFQSLLYLPLYIAIDKGFFQKEGLAVEKVTAGSGSNAVSAVIGGSAQFSLQDPMIAVLANLKGASVKPIAAVINGVPMWVVGKSAAQGPSALAGQTIAAAIPPSTGTYLVERLLKEKNIPAHLLFVKLGTELAPILAGQATAEVESEPQIQQALDDGLHMEYSFAQKYAGDYAFSSIDTSASFIQSHPGAVQKFVDGLQAAEKYMQAHPKGTLKVAEQEFSSLSPSEVDKAVQFMLHSGVWATNVMITPSAYAHAISLQEFLGNIKPGSAPYAQEVDPTFAQKAVAAHS